MFSFTRSLIFYIIAIVENVIYYCIVDFSVIIPVLNEQHIINHPIEYLYKIKKDFSLEIKWGTLSAHAEPLQEKII